MILEPSQSKIHEAGRSCFYQNGCDGRCLCPYSFKSDEYKVWMGGFKQGKQEIELEEADKAEAWSGVQ